MTSSLATQYEKSFFIDAKSEKSNFLSNTYAILTFNGKLDHVLIQKAIVNTFNSPCFHQMFFIEGNEVYKKYLKQAVSVPYIDISDSADPEGEFQDILKSEYQKKIMLTDEPLFKFRLCKLEHEKNKAIFMVHHICLDGRGFDLFISEVIQTYDKLKNNVFIDKAEEIKICCPYEEESKQNNDIAFRIWEETLDKNPLTVDFGHSINVDKRHSDSQYLKLDSELSKKIKRYSRAQKITPNIFFKSLYALLISRMADQDVIAMTSPMDRRNKQQRKEIGCFVNIRLDVFDLRNSCNLREYFNQVKVFHHNTKQHTDLPYFNLVKHLKRHSDNPELMTSNIAFGITTAIDDTLYIDDNCLMTMSYQFQELNADVQLLFCESMHQRFHFRFDYIKEYQRFELFNGFLTRFKTLIDWCLENENPSLSEIPFLLEREKNVISEVNSRVEPFPKKTLAQLLHLWIVETPSNIALIDTENNVQFTYQALHQRISDVAFYLSTLSVKSDIPGCVVINLSCLVDTVIVILASQYCGLPFTCVDAYAPIQRKKQIMSGISPIALFGDSIGAEDNSQYAHILGLSDIPKSTHLFLPVSFDPEWISQYIFTSGTTGIPKAVPLSHRALISNLHNKTVIPIGKRLLYSANEAFDAATLQLWLAFLHGRTLVIPKRNQITDPDALSHLIKSYSVDHIFLTTGLFDTYMLANKKSLFDGIEILLFGGDSVSKHAITKGLKLNIPYLINLYGPTEASIYVTSHACTENDVAENNIPIGQPRANASVFILDKNDNLLGSGMVGQIVIAGEGLAHGYIGDAELNSVFCYVLLPDINKENPIKIYRTGDYGYYKPDGTIIFSGRKDAQIKLRGFRIELDDIRHAIESIHGINMATVIFKQNGKNKQLWGYYQSDTPLDNEDIYMELTQLLPNYMIPSQLIHLDVFPLSRSGKLDKKSLPEPIIMQHSSDELTPLAKIVLEEAAEVLELESLSLSDDFISLGGDSISSILFSVSLEAKGVQISTTDIMKYRRFSDMLPYMLLKENKIISFGKKEGSFDLLPIQKWFFSQNYLKPAHFNQAVLLQLPLDAHLDNVTTALYCLTHFHDTFELRFNKKDQQAFVDVEQVNVEISAATCSNWHEVEQEVAALNASFDLKTGVLFKAIFIRLTELKQPYLYLCAHHLIVDGVSWRRLVSDLQGYYENGQAYAPVPYSNTQCYQSQLKNQLFTQDEVDHWLTIGSYLPKHIPYTQEKDSRIQRQKIVMLSSQTQTLLSKANLPYDTKINELLISTLCCLLKSTSGQFSILLEGHGRKLFNESIRCETTVGWFTSIFPFHIENASDNWSSLIKQTKQTLRSTPEKGDNYLLIAYGNDNLEVQEKLQKALMLPVSFNFLGRFGKKKDDAWCIQQKFTQHLVSQDNKPLRTLDINAWISQDQLNIEFELASNEINGYTLPQLCSAFETTINELIGHCCDSKCHGGLVPHDIIDIKLPQRTIEVLEEIGTLENIYPVTDFQRELLYVNRINPDHQIDQLYFDISGELNVTAFRQAWESVLKKHDILRAAFDDNHTVGQPLALIFKQVTLPFQHFNWEDLPIEIQKQSLEKAIFDERQRPFNWNEPPLLRLYLAQTTPLNHLFLFTFHHVLFDGWSMQIFLQEMMQYYTKFVEGKEISVNPKTFAPFPRWLSKQDKREAKAFWTAYLSNAPMNMRIPYDNITGKSKGLRIQSQKRKLNKDVSEKLRYLAIKHQTTLNQICQIAWAMTLGKYNQTRDIVFGTTLTKRPSGITQIMEMVGLFVATPPLRLSLKDSLSDMVLQISSVAESRLNHAFYDLNQYDEAWRPTPQFGTLFVFENYPDKQEKAPHSLQLQHKGTVSGTNHQIVLCVFPGDELGFSLYFDNTEILIALAEQIADDYCLFLNQLIRLD